MRVYEFAKEKGITSAAVMKLAEACDVEVYSALSPLEADDIETLSRRFLQDDPAAMKAEAAAVAERRRAKAAKAAAAQAEKDKAQAEAHWMERPHPQYLVQPFENWQPQAPVRMTVSFPYHSVHHQ